ncbi:MAG: hypothetical protein QXR19_16910 [Candidatus Jordarchaeaceae archaeon]
MGEKKEMDITPERITETLYDFTILYFKIRKALRDLEDAIVKGGSKEEVLELCKTYFDGVRTLKENEEIVERFVRYMAEKRAKKEGV